MAATPHETTMDLAAPSPSREGPADTLADRPVARQPGLRLVGRTVGGYRLLRLLGEGAMSSVYLAEHLTSRGRVAVKMLRADRSRDPIVVKSFETEAALLGRIDHDNVVRIVDAGRQAEGRWVVMEALDGRTLREVIRDEPDPTLSRRLGLAVQIAKAIQAVHAAGLVHRDVKPGNLLVLISPDGHERVKLLDFGLAALTHPDVGAAVGSAAGTPAYMAPEQVTGEPVDERVDVYSLGVVLYELLTGHTPFAGNSPHHLLINHLTVAPPPLDPDGSLGVPAALEELVLKCLAKHRNDRPRSALSVAARIRAICAACEIPLVEPPPGSQGRVWRRS